MKQSDQNLIWIDLEMTGLQPNEDRIIEIATIVTNTDLNILAEGPVIAINQAESRLSQMDEWNTTQHNASGLVKRVKASQFDEAFAENSTLDFLQQWVPAKASPMCGNTICQDRRFLANYMPRLEQYFHYRNLDVTTLKILAQRWNKNITKGFNKTSKHLALDDVRDSIDELKYYRKHFINLTF